jgi:hypothetical protein
MTDRFNNGDTTIINFDRNKQQENLLEGGDIKGILKN